MGKFHALKKKPDYMNVPVCNRNQCDKGSNSCNQITFNSIINVTQQYVAIIYSKKYPME